MTFGKVVGDLSHLKRPYWPWYTSIQVNKPQQTSNKPHSGICDTTFERALREERTTVSRALPPWAAAAGVLYHSTPEETIRPVACHLVKCTLLEHGRSKILGIWHLGYW